MFIELILAARRKSSRKRLTFFFVNYKGFLRYSRYCCTSPNNLKGKRDILIIKRRSKPKEFEQTKTKRKKRKMAKKPYTIPVNFTESSKMRKPYKGKRRRVKKKFTKICAEYFCKTSVAISRMVRKIKYTSTLSIFCKTPKKLPLSYYILIPMCSFG